MAVDTFAIISGLFLFQTINKKGELSDPYIYIYIRFKRFFPYILVAYIITFLVQVFYISPPSSVQDWENILLNGLSEISVLDIYMLAFGRWPINAPAWTVSIIFLVECIIYCCAWYSKRLFKGLILPVSFILACVVYTRYDISPTGDNRFHLEACRIWIDICISLLCFQVAHKIQKIAATSSGRTAITVLELVSHAVFLMLVNSKTSGNYYWAGLMISVFMVSVAYSQASYLAALVKKIGIAPHLANLSLGIYLTHRSVLLYFFSKYADPYVRYSHKFEFVAAVFAVAVLYNMGLKAAFKIWKKTRFAALWQNEAATCHLKRRL